MTVSNFNEIDYLLRINAEGIQHFDSVDGMNNRIMDWLSTPEGTVADAPAWGSPLRSIQFQPTSMHLEIELQMTVVQKIRYDVRDITVRGIDVSFPEKDLCRIVIFHNLGIFDESISLEGAASGVI